MYKYLRIRSFSLLLVTTFLLPAAFPGLTGDVRAQSISTFAGTPPTAPGNSGYTGDGGSSTLARLNQPNDVALDAAGNIFIADLNNHVIRRVDAVSGIISTFAGTGKDGNSGDGGQAVDARLSYPSGLTFDAAGNLYVADEDYCVIRKISPSGIITTIAGDPNQAYNNSGDGGPAIKAGIAPTNVAADAAGNIFIVDQGGNTVRKIDAVTGIISKVAGGGSNGSPSYTGPATGVNFNYVVYVALDATGNLYISDLSTIRKMDASGNITTIAGNGGTISPFNYSGPAVNAGIAASAVRPDGSGNLYISEGRIGTIRKIDAAGNMTWYAGNGVQAYGGDFGSATGSGAFLSVPNGMVVDGAGNLFVAEGGNSIVRKIGSLPAVQAITFADISILYGAADFALTGSTTSGLSLTYTIADPTVATITGSTVHLLKAGTTTITAVQGGTINWQPATVTVNLVVQQPNQAITFEGDITTTYGDPDFALTATASSGLPVDYTIADPTIATITNGVVHLLQAGLTTITAIQGGDGVNFTAAPPVTVTLTVIQDIPFDNITRDYGNDLTLTAVAPGGQPVGYTFADTTIASIIDGNVLHLLKAGTTTIIVSQVGSMAPPVRRTLTVNKVPLTIKANDQNKQQGAPNPPLTVSYTGFVYGETQSALSAEPTATTLAITSSPEGTYPIAVSGATADSYTIMYQAGTLTVGPPAGEAVIANKLDALIIGGTLQARVAVITTQNAVLQLVDMTGRVLLTEAVPLTGGMVNTFQVPVFNLAHGAYIVTVRGGGLKLTDKIIY